MDMRTLLVLAVFAFPAQGAETSAEGRYGELCASCHGSAVATTLGKVDDIA